MSRGFSIAHSQVTPGLGSRSNEMSGTFRQPHNDSDSLHSQPQTQLLVTGADSALDDDISPLNGHQQSISMAHTHRTQAGQSTTKGASPGKKGKKPYMNFYCDQEEEDLEEIKQRRRKQAKETQQQSQVIQEKSKMSAEQEEETTVRVASNMSIHSSQRSMKASSKLAAHLKHGQQILPNRNKQSFFRGLEEQVDAEKEQASRRRLDMDNVMEAANDCLLNSGGEGIFEQKAKAGEKPYNEDELQIGKYTVENLLQRDFKEGRANKYTLKIISDPKAVPYWEESRFDNLRRADEAMKVIRKQIAQARRQGKIPPRNMMSTTQAAVDESIFQRKFDEDKELSDSELEEIEEQLTGQTTIKQLAEFKARALGDTKTADRVRANELTHKELLEYIEDEEVEEGSRNQPDPLPQDPTHGHTTHQSDITQEDISPHMQMAPTNRYQFGQEGSPMVTQHLSKRLSQDIRVPDHDRDSGPNILLEPSRHITSVSVSGHEDEPLVQGEVVLEEPEQEDLKEQDTVKKQSLHQRRLQAELGVNENIADTQSDMDMLAEIQERAQQASPLGLFSSAAETSSAPKGQRRRTNSLTNRTGAESGKDDQQDGSKEKAIEEAVLKIVTNLDQTVVSADAMKLTQVGFINVLRKVTQEKFKTLEHVKKHFHAKVEKVIAAKDYQIRCQRLIAMDAAKKIISETTKDSTNLFNIEATKLNFAYSRILDLVEYFERVVKEQSTVVALQEQILSKLSLRINAMKIDENVQSRQLELMKSQTDYRQGDVDSVFKQIPKIFYKYEPFELYGGNFVASQQDKQIVMRDQIYQKQETELYQLKMTIESLHSQVDELTWLNGENEQKYSTILEKYRQKKRKIKDERVKLKSDLLYVRQTYESYISKLKGVMQNDHDKFEKRIEFSDLQLDVANAHSKILRGRIDKYLEVAKQAKSVLRVPRLCSMYHNKVKGLTDTEASQLLEKLYNEWYVATKEQRKTQQKSISPQARANNSLLENSKTGTSVNTRPLSKIEETLMDRSIQKNINASKLSGKGGLVRASVNASQDAETRIFSPGTNQSSHCAPTANRNNVFYRSQESNAMWAGAPGTRDSSTFARSSQVIMNNQMAFGRAPNTAGGYAFGSTTGFHEGIGRQRSPEQVMINGRLARAIGNNPGRLQHSMNISGGKRTLRDSDFTTVPNTTRHWRKQTLMQKAAHTLTEIHEMARNNRARSIERVVETAVATVNSDASDLINNDSPVKSQQKIQVQVNSRENETLRGSVNFRDSDHQAETLKLQPDAFGTNINHPIPSQIEDSMMSANSSVNDTFLNSVPTFDQSQLPQPPRTQGRAPNGRRGQSLGVTRTRNQQFMSSSVMVSPDREDIINQANAARASNQKGFRHSNGKQSKNFNQTITYLKDPFPDKHRMPPINAAQINKRQNFSLANKTNRQSTNKKDFLTATTIQSIDQRDKKRMRAHLPAYQIYASHEAPFQQENPRDFVNRDVLNNNSVDLVTSGPHMTQPSIFMPQTSIDEADGTLFTSRNLKATGRGTKETSLFATEQETAAVGQKASEGFLSSNYNSIHQH